MQKSAKLRLLAIDDLGERIVSSQREIAISRILEIFRANVKGKIASKESNKKHSGSRGHALEELFGIQANARNEPDLFGFELKSQTTSKTSFGDWQASWYLFSPSKQACTRSDFLHYFGAPNPNKNNRYSWSGKPFPHVGTWNTFGQTMTINPDNSVSIFYSFSKDCRNNKSTILPLSFQVENLEIAHWSETKLRKHVEKKFNNFGWFKVFTDESGTCLELGFGEGISFESWIDLVKSRVIFLDSGMYDGNIRPYATWRANNSFWDDRIVQRLS